MENEQNQGVLTPDVTSESVQGQKLYTDDDVNRIVAAKKTAAAEKARREVEAEYQAKLANSSQPVDVEALKKEIRESLEADNKKQQEEREQADYMAARKQVIDDYNSKLTATKKDYDDFDDVMKKFPHHIYDPLVLASTAYPNTGDMAYYLAKNRTEAQKILALYKENDIDGFHGEMKALSDSLDERKKAAKNAKNIPEPLSRLKPSVAGADSDRKLSTKDYKRMYRG